MEVAAGRGGSLPMSAAQAPRKEWRAVSEHPLQNNGDEDPDHMKLGQSDERMIYVEGTGALDVDFCSITIDGGESNGDLLQRQISDISRQREHLQQVEIELRAQAIARSEIVGLQSSFDAKIKEHANVTAKLREQLEDRERCIHDMEMKIEEKDREIRAMKIDSEAAWAKEDILREQNKELATFRRERDNLEAERAEHLKQIHEFQEHIHELKDQYRVAQETILYKDEQLRAWVARVQEMDALQSTANQSLQAELRERTDQFNQFWIGAQGQFVEMERVHLQTIQQLQQELAEARGNNGTKYEDSQLALAISESSSYVQNIGNQFNINSSGTANGNPVFTSNGSVNSAPSFVSASSASTKTEHAPGVAVIPSSIQGMSPFLPPGQMAAIHPFVIHPQGGPQSLTQTNSQTPQSQLGHFQSIQPIPTHQHWQNQQMSNQNQYQPYQPSQAEPNLLRSDAQYSYELSSERQNVHPDYLESHSGPLHISGKIITGSREGVQVMNEKVLDSNGMPFSGSQVSEETSRGNPKFRAMLDLAPTMQNGEPKLHDGKSAAATYQLQDEALTIKQPLSAENESGSALSNDVVISSEGLKSNAVGTMPEVPFSTARSSGLLTPGKAPEPTLLDERSLLACIVRAIPAGPSGRIKISTTLPNRLGKMLAPLHWHDYKKQYGKLDDFVSHHPELFVIEGDFIHLREGAQEIISATTAVAKVAAAAAASAPYSSPLSSVAVTPVAHTHRLKTVPSTETKPMNSIPHAQTTVQGYPGGASEKPKQLLTRHSPQPNGVGFSVVQGLSNVKILSKTKNLQELNGSSSDIKLGHSSIHATVENGMILDRAALPSSQNKVASNGRHSITGKQQGRTTGAGQITRR